jgi:hypothetical protein
MFVFFLFFKKNEQKVDHQPDEQRPNSFASAAWVANSGQHKEHAPVDSFNILCQGGHTRATSRTSVPLIQLAGRRFSAVNSAGRLKSTLRVVRVRSRDGNKSNECQVSDEGAFSDDARRWFRVTGAATKRHGQL